MNIVKGIKVRDSMHASSCIYTRQLTLALSILASKGRRCLMSLDVFLRLLGLMAEAKCSQRLPPMMGKSAASSFAAWFRVAARIQPKVGQLDKITLWLSRSLIGDLRLSNVGRPRRTNGDKYDLAEANYRCVDSKPEESITRSLPAIGVCLERAG